MNELAKLDALTGAYNKTAYDERVDALDQAFEPGARLFSFIVVDLNYLKKVNDTYGHEKGDIALKRLYDVLHETFVNLAIYHIGGGEFTIIVEGNRCAACASMVETCNEAIVRASNDTQLEPWERISAAIGYATFDAETDESVEDVFRRADAAMYEHKKAMRATRK